MKSKKVKVNFVFDKKVDNKCWARYNRFIKANGSVWGIHRVISKMINIKEAEFKVDITEMVEKYETIFNMSVPIKGYIVSTPFSMINDNTKKISEDGVIYYSIYTTAPSIVIAHELFHIFFEKYTRRKIKNYDEAKEYFTVIMNDIFGPGTSKGYPYHKKERTKVWRDWKRTKSIDKCVKSFNKRYGPPLHMRKLQAETDQRTVRRGSDGQSIGGIRGAGRRFFVRLRGLL